MAAEDFYCTHCDVVREVKEETESPKCQKCDKPLIKTTVGYKFSWARTIMTLTAPVVVGLVALGQEVFHIESKVYYIILAILGTPSAIHFCYYFCGIGGMMFNDPDDGLIVSGFFKLRPKGTLPEGYSYAPLKVNLLGELKKVAMIAIPVLVFLVIYALVRQST